MRTPTDTSDGRSLAPVIFTILAMDALILGLVIGVLVSPWIGLAAGVGALAAPVLIGGPVIALANRISGWSSLARACPSRERGEVLRRGAGASLAMRRRWCGYGSCITWAADAAYLHLSIMRPFNAMSPGISIPWSEIDFDESLPGKGLIVCDTAAGIRLWLPRVMLENEATRPRVNP